MADSARRAFLTELIDYAGLFPPASLPMEEAAEEYRRHRQGPEAWMLARFICPASRLGELERHLGGAPWRLSVILDGPGGHDWAEGTERALESTARFVAESGERASVELVEGHLPVEGLGDRPGSLVRSFAELLGSSGLSAEAFLEVPLTVRWDLEAPGALEAIAATGGLGVKLRCGGAGVTDFPTPEQVAWTVAACGKLGLRLKATAGLHHPFRHFDPMGQHMRHGFVNLVGAAVLSDRLSPEDLVDVVADRDGTDFSLTDEAFRWRDLKADPDRVATARREVLVAYGSCSFREPVDDLARLGILDG